MIHEWFIVRNRPWKHTRAGSPLGEPFPIVRVDWVGDGLVHPLEMTVYEKRRADLIWKMLSEDWWETVPGWNKWDAGIPSFRAPEEFPAGSVEAFRMVAMWCMNMFDVEYGWEER